MRDWSFLLALFLSMIAHSVWILFFMTPPKKILPEKRLSFEVVWEKKKSSPAPLASQASSIDQCVNTIKNSHPREKKSIPMSSLLSPKEKMKDKTLGDSQSSPTYKKKNTSPKPPPHPVKRTSYHPLPPYPWISRKRNQEGIVMIQVKTDGNGHTQEATLYKSSGYDSLDKAALEALKSWVFAERFPYKILSISFRLRN